MFTASTVLRFGREPNRTDRKIARPRYRPCVDHVRPVAARGTRSRRYLRQCARASVSMGKSPRVTRTCPVGTSGAPSCVAASRGIRKLAASIHAADLPASVPKPTEPCQPSGSVRRNAEPETVFALEAVAAATTAAANTIEIAAAEMRCITSVLRRRILVRSLAPTPISPRPKLPRRRRAERFRPDVDMSRLKADADRRGAVQVDVRAALQAGPCVRATSRGRG